MAFYSQLPFVVIFIVSNPMPFCLPLFLQFDWLTVLNWNLKRNNYQQQRPDKTQLCGFYTYTANIFNVIFTVVMCVPFSNVITLYGLHQITAPSTVEKCKH